MSVTTDPLEVRGIHRSATAGTVAPIWFWATLALLAVLHGVIDVSGHQLLRYGFLMYLGFFAYGALTLIFVWGLRQRLRPGRRSTAALIFLALFGCGPLLAVFTMGVEQGPPQSWHAALHFSGLLLVTLMPIIALPLFASAVWSDPRWRGVGPFSLVVAGVVTAVVFLPPAPAEGYAIWTGPGSMADIVLIGSWQIVASRRLARLSKRPESMGETAKASADENTVK